MKSFSCAVVALILVAFCGSTFACNGYKSRLNSISNCGKYESVIKVSPNANATIDDKCNLFANGCVTASEDINEGKVRVIIKLNGLELQRIDRDVCDGVLKSNIPQLRNVIQLFGLPDSCPIKAGQVCATEDQKISLNRYKDFLALANGKVEILIKVLHGKAGKSCIRVDLEIFR